MFDVFTERIEVLIKDGMANLYWYKGDLHKAWLRSGVPAGLCRGDRPAKGRRKPALVETQADGHPIRALAECGFRPAVGGVEEFCADSD